MARFIFPAGIGQAVDGNEIKIREARLTPGSTNATAVIYANGVAVAYLAAPANGPSDVDAAYSGGNPFEGNPAAGPVTCDVVGTGAHLSIDI